MGVYNYYVQECTVLAKYIEQATGDHLVDIVRTEEMRTRRGIMSFLQDGKGGTTESINEAHQDSLNWMPMHGKFWRQQSGATICGYRQFQ